MESGQIGELHLSVQQASRYGGNSLEVDVRLEVMVATARTTLGFRPFRAATASYDNGYFDDAGTSATGGVLRPVAAMLGSGTWTTAIQASTGSYASASRLLGQVS